MEHRYEVPRTSGLYDPQSDKPFALSRNKIEQFTRCPRCFYLDRRLGIPQPPGYPLSLNIAVDALLKREFDYYRTRGEAHPLLSQYGVSARPAWHAQLDTWRNNFKGARYIHILTNLEVFGALDDLWVDDDGLYHVVDYKATARKEVVQSLEGVRHADGYRRQLDVYVWLLRQLGLNMSDTAYWLYVTGDSNGPWFNGRLEFRQRIIPYESDTQWIEPALGDIKAVLELPMPPASSDQCDYCRYFTARFMAEA